MYHDYQLDQPFLDCNGWPSGTIGGALLVVVAATGRLGSPKKGGAGGKGAWGT